MNKGSNSKEDPGDDRAILRICAQWVTDNVTAMRTNQGASVASVQRLPDGSFMMALNIPRGKKRQHHFVNVDPFAIRKDRWSLIQLGPGVWDLDESVHVPGQLHAFVTLVGVPEPPPWKAESNDK